MKKYKWEIKLSLFLLTLSFLLYLIQYLAFGNLPNIYENILGQLAFLPIYVLLVTIVIEQLLDRKEKLNKREKMNVVVGVFFNEIGRDMLIRLLGYNKTNKIVTITPEFFEKSVKDISKELKQFGVCIKAHSSMLIDFKSFMLEKKDFLLQIVQNPNLYEHESFTEAILAVFHMYEELSKRKDMNSLDKGDYDHLSKDLENALEKLAIEWLIYMKRLKKEYPYLFGVELKNNPFQEIIK